MSDFFTVFLVGGLLAGVGYAAWVLSRARRGTRAGGKAQVT